MPSIINASTTSTSGLVQTADASGVLQLQSNGVTGLTVGTGGLLTAANGMVFSSMTLGTATTGEMEYDGRVPYFTPAGTQRGIIPGMQYFRLDTALAGANVTSAQNTFGVGVILSSGTVYAFEFLYTMTKTVGATSHTLSHQFGGTATINNILSYANYTNGSSGAGSSLPAATATLALGIYNSTTGIGQTNSITSASLVHVTRGNGTISVNAGGTFVPQYTLSAAPGGAYTTAVGSYFLIYPIGAAGANTSVGTWA